MIDQDEEKVKARLEFVISAIARESVFSAQECD